MGVKQFLSHLGGILRISEPFLTDPGSLDSEIARLIEAALIYVLYFESQLQRSSD